MAGRVDNQGHFAIALIAVVIAAYIGVMWLFGFAYSEYHPFNDIVDDEILLPTDIQT